MTAEPVSLPDEAGSYLQQLGARVRDARTRLGLSRKALAGKSGVSERYLAQLESGQGNISILLLRQVSGALETPLTELLSEHDGHPIELTLLIQYLEKLSPKKLLQAKAILSSAFGEHDPLARRNPLPCLRQIASPPAGSQRAAAERRFAGPRSRARIPPRGILAALPAGGRRLSGSRALGRARRRLDARCGRNEEGKRMKRISAVLAALLLGGGLGCSEGADGGGAVALSPEATKGKQVYQTVCIACHASDPNQAGALGPAVAGSSQELLEAKVIHGEYPPGYTPKRDSRAMVPLPHLQPDIPALAAYLDAVKKGS